MEKWKERFKKIAIICGLLLAFNIVNDFAVIGVIDDPVAPVEAGGMALSGAAYLALRKMLASKLRESVTDLVGGGEPDEHKA